MVWTIVGQIKEKMGRSTHKAILWKPLVKTQKVLPQKFPDGRTFEPSEEDKKPIQVFESVAGHYFNPHETFWKQKTLGTYELHLENITRRRRESKLLDINAETGAPISMNNGKTVVFTPQALTQSIAAEWVRNAHASVKGMNTGILVMLLLFGFGAILGLLIGMNAPAITHAISPTHTPTPTPFR